MFNPGNNIGYVPSCNYSNSVRPCGLNYKTIFDTCPGRMGNYVCYSDNVGASGVTITDVGPGISMNKSSTVSEFIFKSRELIGPVSDWVPSNIKFTASFGTPVNGLDQRLGIFDEYMGLGFGYNGTSFGTFIQEAGQPCVTVIRILTTGGTGTVNINIGPETRQITTTSGAAIQLTAGLIGALTAVNGAEIQALGSEAIILSPFIGRNTTVTLGTNTTMTYTIPLNNSGVSPAISWTSASLPSWLNPLQENAYAIEVMHGIGQFILKAFNSSSGNYEKVYTWNMDPNRFSRQWLPLSFRLTGSQNCTVTLGRYTGQIPEFSRDSTNHIPGCSPIFTAVPVQTIKTPNSIAASIYSGQENPSPVQLMDVRVSGVFAGQIMSFLSFFGTTYRGNVSKAGTDQSTFPMYTGTGTYDRFVSVMNDGTIGYNTLSAWNQLGTTGRTSVPLYGGYNGVSTTDMETITFDSLYIWPGQRLTVIYTGGSSANFMGTSINYMVMNKY